MMPTYSVAKRVPLAEIVHDLKHVSQVEVTRRGRPVAILISIEEFEKLRSGNVVCRLAVVSIHRVEFGAGANPSQVHDLRPVDETGRHTEGARRGDAAVEPGACSALRSRQLQPVPGMLWVLRSPTVTLPQ